MRGMILAAGLGTRLRPLTDERPKPLVPVGDRPAVAHVAAELARAGVEDAVLNTHHLAGAFSAEILAALPLRLTVVHEPSILGTGGGVAHAAPHLGDGDVVVWNGDILAELDLRAMIALHHASGAAATLAVAPRADERGTVGLDDAGSIARLRGQRFGDEHASADFLGIYVLSAAFRARLPSPGCLIGDGVLPALREGARIATFAMPAAWDDVGNLASYLAANARWLGRTGRESFVAEGARVAEGVALRGCVVGAGAEVRGEGLLERVVVWPGAIAEAPLADAVVTPRGLVLAG
jgi:mannose-1-phosphate guanylyltransferase